MNDPRPRLAAARDMWFVLIALWVLAGAGFVLSQSDGELAAFAVAAAAPVVPVSGFLLWIFIVVARRFGLVEGRDAERDQAAAADDQG